MGMRVGFIGLGRMGAPMAGHLLAAGHEVTVFGRDRAVTAALAADGATVAESLPELGSVVDVICTCLPNGEVVRDVLLGADGALSQAAPNTIVVDHSTISPQHARELSTDCRALGFEFLDAPISGGPEGAAAGKLAVFLGGDLAAFDRVLPVVESYSSTVVRLGESGTGQVAKLANQMIIACTVLGIAEAFSYGQAAGVDAAKMLEVLHGATAESAMLRTRVPVPGLQPGMPASRDWAPGFTADFMAKDLRFAIDDVHQVGVPAPGLELVAALLDRARESGSGDCDWTIFSQHFTAPPTS